MTDIGRTVARDLLVAGGQDLDGLLGPLAAYLDAVEARIGALERRLTAVPLMTAADAARYARVNVETILRAVRAGELPVAGYVGRSPRISRDALSGLAVEDLDGAEAGLFEVADEGTLRQGAGFRGSSTFRVGLHGCGSGIEFPGDEVDHGDVVAIGAITTGSAFCGLDE